MLRTHRPRRCLPSAGPIAILGVVALAAAACGPATPTPRPTAKTLATPRPAASTAVDETSSPVDPGTGSRAIPGTVSGRVTTADGAPVAGAHVLVRAREYASESEVVSASDGTYAANLEVSDATYVVYAWLGPVDFNGHTYYLPLDFVGGDPAVYAYDPDGIVQDFQWDTSGQGTWAAIPDEPDAYNGGWFDVSVYDRANDPGGDDAMQLVAGTQIRFDLQPLTSRIDGTTIEPLSATIGLDKDTGPYHIGSVGTVYDIPIAQYEVTATLIDPDGSTSPLLVAWQCTDSLDGTADCPFIKPTAMAPSVDIDILPASLMGHPAPYDSTPTQNLELYVTAP